MNNLSEMRKSPTAEQQMYLATAAASALQNSAAYPTAATLAGNKICSAASGLNLNCDYYCSDDIWSTNEIGELLCRLNTPLKHVFFDVLLPSGFLMPIQCPTYRTLAQLKQDVFIQAKRLPPNARLNDISNYIFFTIGLDGVHVGLYDEQKPVSQLYSCLPILELVEPEANLEEKVLAQKISTAMGYSLAELERNLTEETELFRLELFDVCRQAEAERGTFGTSHYAFFREPLITRLSSKAATYSDIKEVHEDDFDFVQYPEDSAELEKLALDRLRGRLEFSGYYLEVWYSQNEASKAEFNYSVKIKDIFGKTPANIISAALERLSDIYGFHINQISSEFILQIAGQRVFIVGDEGENITQFQYVRSCLENYRIPYLILRRKELVFKDYVKPPPIFQPAYSRRQEQNALLKPSIQKQTRVQQQTRSFWDLDENLRMRVHSVSHMTISDNDKVFVRVAIAAGLHVLDIQETTLVAPNNPRFLDGGLLEFNVYLKDLPETAHFSFSLICVRGAGRHLSRSFTSCTNRELLGWTNCRIFDWRHCLLKGKHSMNLWPFPKDFQDKKLMLNLLGLPGINLGDTATRIEIEFARYKDNFVYKFPSESLILKYIKVLRERQVAIQSKESRLSQDNLREWTSCDDEDVITTLLKPDSVELKRLLQLQRCLDASKLDLSDQKFLWRMRYKIHDFFPQLLVVLADCAIVWREREKTCEFYAMLDDWPALRIETAIELLDGRYSDVHLRAMAVKNLECVLNNDQLRLHLLVLVQAVRYEPFAASPLAIMLVRRSLLSFRIGHTVFWLIRAELAHLLNDDRNKIPSLYFRYALMLEAICRGNMVYLDSIIKQVDMISTLTLLSTQVRTQNFTTKKLQQELEARKESLQFMDSPLSPIEHLGELIIEECRVLGSAKMPLRLAWRNSEYLAHIASATHQLIFKNGDDMRQDMLTLQVMRIMESKWKSYNLDYCMTLYEVLPMGRNIGLIQVVQNCLTLFEIQCEARPVASSLNMDTYLLHKYLYQKYESTQYMERVERFRSSLAGYCIATYVIGIRDRHQDNIMIADDGRIFHIDFGHFLGHTKRKLGINRERTEFILTEHFLCAIAHSKDYRKSHEFATFRDMCIKGFMIVHHHARFYIALFRMMLCMGLPELSSQNNVDFLKQSLMYNIMERERVSEAFQAIFDQAIRGDWSVSVNWFFHSVKHI